MRKELKLATALLLLTISGTCAAGSIDYFSVVPNSAISGHNTARLNAVTPEQCASACREPARAGWCVSFDYFKTSAQCDLSSTRASEVGLKNNYPGNPYDHYALRSRVLMRFDTTPNAAIQGYNNQRLSSVSPEACAAACTSDSRKAWCRSFDYYKASKQCDLSDKRASDVPAGLKTTYAGNPYDHYNLTIVAGTPNPVPGNKHVLVIGIDGLRGDALECPGCATTPALSALMAGGAYHRNVLAGGAAVDL